MSQPKFGVCRVCKCTDHDCTLCVERTGGPCHWVEPDLCSACAPGDAKAVRAWKLWLAARRAERKRLLAKYGRKRT